MSSRLELASTIVGWMIAAGVLGLLVAGSLQQRRIRRLRDQLEGRPVRRVATERAVLVAQLDRVVRASARKDRVIVALEDEIGLLGRLLETKDELLGELREESGGPAIGALLPGDLRRRIELARRTNDELAIQLGQLGGLALDALLTDPAADPAADPFADYLADDAPFADSLFADSLFADSPVAGSPVTGSPRRKPIGRSTDPDAGDLPADT